MTITRTGRLAALTPSLLLLAALTATPAHASTQRVEHGSNIESSEFDDTEYCAAEGVPSFHVVMTVQTDFTVLFDADDQWVRATAHHVQKNTLSANGKTLYEEDHYTNVFYPDGTSTTVGSYGHIRGDQGIVLRDSGRMVQGPDHSVEFVAGKWPQFFGTTFCRELLP